MKVQVVWTEHKEMIIEAADEKAAQRELLKRLSEKARSSETLFSWNIDKAKVIA